MTSQIFHQRERDVGGRQDADARRAKGCQRDVALLSLVRLGEAYTQESGCGEGAFHTPHRALLYGRVGFVTSVGPVDYEGHVIIAGENQAGGIGASGRKVEEVANVTTDHIAGGIREEDVDFSLLHGAPNRLPAPLHLLD